METSLAHSLGVSPSINWTNQYVGSSRHQTWPFAITLPSVVDHRPVAAVGKFAFQVALDKNALKRSIQLDAEGFATSDPSLGLLAIEWTDQPLVGYCARQNGRVKFLPVPGSRRVESGNFNFKSISVLPIALNVYIPSQRLAEVLGFVPGANFMALAEDTGMAFAPKRWCLDGPSYLLLEVDIQHSCAVNIHRFGNDTLTQIMAVLPLYHTGYKLERGAPMSKIMTGPTVINSLSFRLLNPDHSLYRLHGREWAISLLFGHIAEQASTLCP
jgi:hypothetical protein